MRVELTAKNRWRGQSSFASIESERMIASSRFIILSLPRRFVLW